ncbi:MAG: 5-methyltetrahydrofolate--homocysteine methyltransferase, partial [Actinomycetota bacterium]|nr:5-methyltetrahydrofolate--homocysteine methyltransferase [Actinomycetota bacterium]
GEALEGCNEQLVATRPDLVARMHDEFFSVGSDGVETATFGAFPLVLNEYGLAGQTFELNKRAAEIAREVATGHAADGRPRFVIGSIGPGTRLPSLGQIRYETLRDDFALQVDGLIAGGVDVLLVETVYDLLQAKAAINGARAAMRRAGLSSPIPIMVQVTVETTGRMLVGTEIGAALTALEAMRPDVIGMNCATGPAEMTEHLRYLAQHARTFLSALPNAGLPSVVDGRTHYDLTPAALAEAHERFASEFGVNVVGGCCGTTPEHLRQVVERLDGRAPVLRSPEFEPGCSSIYSHVPFEQELAYLAIGERTNANGSRKFRDAMLEADWDTCVVMAREQVKEGAHVLDVCVDYVGRDGAIDMDEIAGRFATQASLPLVFDSTEPLVLEAGLQHHGGKALLNSANLEEGEDEGKRMDRVFRLAREYGAAVICLTIDEEGQARTADWKLRVARRIYDIAIERYGLEPADLIFDALTFPLSTGDDDLRRDAMETIEAIRRIKAELPGAHTVLGLSNVSFGLKPSARHVLNSVFLHECREAGLDAAIVHAARIVPLHRIDEQQRTAALDLIYDRRRENYDPLTEFMALFENVEAGAIEKEDRSGWPVAERLKHRIIDGARDGLETDLDEQLTTMTPLEIVNDVLLDGMKVVGELFGSGQMQLPFVLQSAETMKAAVAFLEPMMEKADAAGKGTVVLATVKGDVHDIGKNLVDIILTNNGYLVYNLGIKIAINEMIEKALEVNADAIGMSGLLVKSTLIMRDNLEELNTRGLADRVPVLLGGAALTRNYVERDLREVYDGRVFYGKDAFEGLRTMDTLVQGRRDGTLDEKFGREPGGRNLPPRKSQQPVDETIEIPARSDVATDVPVFTPPFVGSRVAKGISLDEIAGYVNETALFRNQWQFRPESGEPDPDFKARIRPTLRAQLDIAKQEGLLVPAAAWGYFAVNSDGENLVVWKDDTRTQEWLRFQYPRQRKAPWLSIADFFRPIDSGETDYAAFHVVTMGSAASAREKELFAADKYQDYLLLHGLSVEMTEALAELWHRRIREEWGFADEDGPTLTGLFKQQYRGSRYSWGYPACPDLDDQTKVAELLEIDRIGVALTEEFHLVPEQSTSAIIVPHPEAKYFVV